jgi:hypothetical protein
VQNDTNASKIRVLSSVAFSAIMKHLNNFWIYSMSVTLNKQEHWFKDNRIDWSPLLCLYPLSCAVFHLKTSMSEYCLSRCYDPSWTKYEVWHDDFLMVKGLMLTARWKITIISLFYCFVLLIINWGFCLMYIYSISFHCVLVTISRGGFRGGVRVYLQCVGIFNYRLRVNHSWKSCLLNCLINVV